MFGQNKGDTPAGTKNYKKFFYDCIYDTRLYLKLSKDTQYLVGEWVAFAENIGASKELLAEQRTELQQFPLAKYVAAKIMTYQRYMLRQDNDIREAMVNKYVNILIQELKKIYRHTYKDDTGISDDNYWNDLTTALKNTTQHQFNSRQILAFYLNNSLLICFSHRQTPEIVASMVFKPIPIDFIDVLPLTPAQRAHSLQTSQRVCADFQTRLRTCYDQITAKPAITKTDLGVLLIALVIAIYWLRRVNPWLLVPLLTICSGLYLGTSKMADACCKRATQHLVRPLPPGLQDFFYKLGYCKLATLHSSTLRNESKSLLFITRQQQTAENAEAIIRLGIGQIVTEFENMRVFKKPLRQIKTSMRGETLVPAYLAEEIPDPFKINRSYLAPTQAPTLTQQKKLKGRAPEKLSKFFRPTPKLDADSKRSNDTKVVDEQYAGRLIERENGSCAFLADITAELLAQVKNDQLRTLLDSEITFARDKNQSGLKHLDGKRWELKHMATDERVVYEEIDTISITIDGKAKSMPLLKPIAVVRGADKKHIVEVTDPAAAAATAAHTAVPTHHK